MSQSNSSKEWYIKFIKQHRSEKLEARKSEILSELKKAKLSKEKLMDILAAKLVLLEHYEAKTNSRDVPLAAVPTDINNAIVSTKKQAVSGAKSEHGRNAVKQKRILKAKNKVANYWYK